MKFISTLAVASTIAALASAQSIQINNPTVGSTWTVGSASNYLGWTGSCAGLGNSSTAVDVQLVNGPSTSVRFVASLGTINCSGNNARADITVPGTIVSGDYSLRVMTNPESYSNQFTIVNAASPAVPSATSAPAPAATSAPAGKSAGSSLVASSLVALTGVAVAALQFAL
ncbi:hypothetical protein BGX28_006918 [Mortierella sp. GBA30]|nr:hypothetical protein BGX28_006918 [Mortierella sp. GBA30]